MAEKTSRSTNRSGAEEPAGDRARGDPAVHVENVTKEFGDLVAVDNVSFDVRSGEFFTILGPSGSGKSTLLRVLAGLETPTSGALYISGRDMERVPPEKRPTNMVFQHLALFPHKSVYENLEFGLKMSGVSSSERRDRADDMLETLGLGGYGTNSIDELSGGEQQRIALGRALLANPDILLLDEPLSSLDRKLKEEMQLELRRIHDELNSTFLYVTHDQDVAMTASDRVAIINDGKLLQIATPRTLYEKPATRFVAEFIGETNLLEGSVVGVGSGTATVEFDGLGAVSVETGDAVGVGDRLEVSLRPEEVVMGESGAELANRFDGTVTEAVYRGDRTRYEVDTGDTDLLVQRSRRKNDRAFEEDQPVTVGWPANAGYVVNGEE